MSEFIIVHRRLAQQGGGSENLFPSKSPSLDLKSHRKSRPKRQVSSVGPESALVGESPFRLVWTTCLRQIFFVDSGESVDAASPSDEIYVDSEAEVFLAEVLCGLRSSLLGETEVFGQFKQWWGNLPDDHPWKRRFQPRIENLFALVKEVREKALYGLGSQSYGSFLRRHLNEEARFDLIGAGHLARELIPWVPRASFRVWCRDPQKAMREKLFANAKEILPMTDKAPLFHQVVVAAPLGHSELERWLKDRAQSPLSVLIDFRADSMAFSPAFRPERHWKLPDVSEQLEQNKLHLEKKIREAHVLIQQWKKERLSAMQVRPFGWDDL